jgi:hypothetical protein
MIASPTDRTRQESDPNRMLKPSHRRLLALLAAPVLLTGCARWEVESSPRAALTGRGHRVVRIDTHRLTHLELRDPQVSRDTLFGWSSRPGAPVRGRVAVPLADVTRVERRVKDDRALAIGAAAALVALLVVARP